MIPLPKVWKRRFVNTTFQPTSGTESKMLPGPHRSLKEAVGVP